VLWSERCPPGVAVGLSLSPHGGLGCPVRVHFYPPTPAPRTNRCALGCSACAWCCFVFELFASGVLFVCPFACACGCLLRRLLVCRPLSPLLLLLLVCPLPRQRKRGAASTHSPASQPPTRHTHHTAAHNTPRTRNTRLRARHQCPLLLCPSCRCPPSPLPLWPSWVVRSCPPRPSPAASRSPADEALHTTTSHTPTPHAHAHIVSTLPVSSVPSVTNLCAHFSDPSSSFPSSPLASPRCSPLVRAAIQHIAWCPLVPLICAHTPRAPIQP
jgi:hypothetical protein